MHGRGLRRCTGSLVLAAVVAFCGGLPVSAAEPPLPEKMDYNFHVRPLLADRCYTCHGPDANRRQADLRLDTPDGALAAGVIVPGKPDESPLVERITAEGEERMPPAESKLSLSPNEIERLRRWIAEGAEYKAHWAFVPVPAEVPLPQVSDPNWVRDPLDHFVLARLDREGLRPSPPASREDWIRRATFDLTGLPPTPDEVAAFLADDSPQALSHVADRLLASRRFGERMALEWLDVARYADSFGYQADGDTQVWPWRDWVIEAFNQNLPFDQFITWQLAGDLLESATREQRLATAFCRLHRMTNEGGSIFEEWRNEYVSDRVHTFGTAFLALTLECARCHDHKYDPVSMQDYYSLGAVLQQRRRVGHVQQFRFSADSHPAVADAAAGAGPGRTKAGNRAAARLDFEKWSTGAKRRSRSGSPAQTTKRQSPDSSLTSPWMRSRPTSNSTTSWTRRAPVPRRRPTRSFQESWAAPSASRGMTLRISPRRR